jgi:Flp pilus assembly protein TadG
MGAHMIKGRLPHSHRGATASVELALLAPFLLAALFGIWEIGRLVQIQQVVDNAAREGARQAARGDLTSAQVRTAVTNYLEAGGVDTTSNGGVTFTYTDSSSGAPVQRTSPIDVNNPSLDVSAASPSDQLHMAVNVPYRNVRWLAINLFLSDTTMMTATADWYCMKNQPLLMNTVIPQAPLN